MPKLLFIAPSAGIALAVMFLPATGLPAAAVALFAGTLAALGIALAQRAADGEERALQLQREQRILLREEQVAHTAHELRTPLAALTTAVELLRDGYATTPEDQTMFLDQAAVAVRHMAFLVNDVVDLAAIESGATSACRTCCSTSRRSCS
jgi:signal transduction histidine kinase